MNLKQFEDQKQNNEMCPPIISPKPHFVVSFKDGTHFYKCKGWIFASNSCGTFPRVRGGFPGCSQKLASGSLVLSHKSQSCFWKKRDLWVLRWKPDRSCCSKLNQIHADQVSQARCLNSAKATPKLNGLSNLNGWDLEICLS